MVATSSYQSFDHVASIYDVMSEVYSLGQIRACKQIQLKYLKPGDRVLFVGCGGGLDVLAAAGHGCQVTAVDTSSKMIDKVRQRLERNSLDATLICDSYENVLENSFDAVCPNFFLNCFRRETMEPMLSQLLHKVRPGGSLLLADVAPPQGNLLARATNRLYLHGAMVPFWAMGMMDWHANHDYVPSLTRHGWDIRSVDSFRMFRLGPVVFRTIVARKNSD